MIKNIQEYFPYTLLVVYLVWAIYFSIDPFSRPVWFVENLPIFIAVLFLILTFKKFRFSNTSYFLMAFFLMFHTFGGHYTFELAPFDFFNNLINYLNLENLFPEGRNNFDRVGHFLVGVFAYPLAEFLYRKNLVKNIFLAIIFGIFALGFWGALYEIIEMYYALIEGGESGMAFLGSQGDIWDAQKDMFLDILGAITISVLFWFNWKSK